MFCQYKQFQYQKNIEEAFEDIDKNKKELNNNVDIARKAGDSSMVSKLTATAKLLIERRRGVRSDLAQWEVEEKRIEEEGGEQLLTCPHCHNQFVTYAPTPVSSPSS